MKSKPMTDEPVSNFDLGVFGAIEQLGKVAVYLLNSSSVKDRSTVRYYKAKDAAVVLMNILQNLD